MKVLMIGPSVKKSKGGMATVIKDILDDSNTFKDITIKHHASYVDGSKLYVAVYSLISFLYFIFFCRGYDIYHLHMASKGSTYRKTLYVKMIKRWNKRVIIHIHGGGFIDFFTNLDVARQSKIKTILQRADTVIALSSEWQAKYQQILGISNCSVIENGIDTEIYKNAACNNDDFINDFLLLGRMTKNKGTYDLIEAVDRIKNAYPKIKVYLAGDGEIEKTKQTVQSLKLDKNIKVIGWVNKKEKIDLLRRVGTVILPSYHEALPMSILEGMAAGKVIVSTNVGAIPEVVKEENGFIISPGDISELARVLSCIMSGEYDVNGISKRNMKKIESNYSVVVMHEKISKCYWNLYKK